MRVIKTNLTAGILFFLSSCTSSGNAARQIPPAFRGHFEDDYGIRYMISPKLFLQEPGVKYHILKWNLNEKYIIAKNDEANPSEKGLYTRIDYMEFVNMKPYNWGFCLTAYKAVNAYEAERFAAADRLNPMKGCGGFPFSRLKRIE